MHRMKRASVTATLSVRNWSRAIDFYKAAFGASELYRVDGGGVAQLSVSGAEFLEPYLQRMMPWKKQLMNGKVR